MKIEVVDEFPGAKNNKPGRFSELIDAIKHMEVNQVIRTVTPSWLEMNRARANISNSINRKFSEHGIRVITSAKRVEDTDEWYLYIKRIGDA